MMLNGCWPTGCIFDQPSLKNSPSGFQTIHKYFLLVLLPRFCTYTSFGSKRAMIHMQSWYSIVLQYTVVQGLVSTTGTQWKKSILLTNSTCYYVLDWIYYIYQPHMGLIHPCCSAQCILLNSLYVFQLALCFQGKVKSIMGRLEHTDIIYHITRNNVRIKSIISRI